MITGCVDSSNKYYQDISSYNASSVILKSNDEGIKATDIEITETGQVNKIKAWLQSAEKVDSYGSYYSRMYQLILSDGESDLIIDISDIGDSKYIILTYEGGFYMLPRLDSDSVVLRAFFPMCCPAHTTKTPAN